MLLLLVLTVYVYATVMFSFAGLSRGGRLCSLKKKEGKRKRNRGSRNKEQEIEGLFCSDLFLD